MPSIASDAKVRRWIASGIADSRMGVKSFADTNADSSGMVTTIGVKTCTKCTLEKPLSDFYYHRSRKHYMSSCKKCNSKACAEYQRKTYQDTEKFVFYQRAYGIRHDKRVLGIPVSENLQQHLLDLWKQQEGRCFYTGRQMTLRGYAKGTDAMTVDRIEPSKGYMEGNLVLCCSIVNRVKQNLSVGELFSLIEEIKSYQRRT